MREVRNEMIRIPSLSAEPRDDVGSLEAEDGLVEHLELAAQLAHVVGHAEAVGHGADAVLEGLQPRPEGQLRAGVRDQSLAEVVAAVADKVQDAPHRVLREEGLLVLGWYSVVM